MQRPPPAARRPFPLLGATFSTSGSGDSPTVRGREWPASRGAPTTGVVVSGAASGAARMWSSPETGASSPGGALSMTVSSSTTVAATSPPVMASGSGSLIGASDPGGAPSAAVSPSTSVAAMVSSAMSMSPSKFRCGPPARGSVARPPSAGATGLIDLRLGILVVAASGVGASLPVVQSRGCGSSALWSGLGGTFSASIAEAAAASPP